MEEVNELRLQIATKKTLSAIDHQGNTLNTNIAEVQAQDYGFVRIFTTHLFSN